MKTVLMLVDRPKSPTEKYAAGTVQVLSDDLAEHFIGTGAARFQSYQQTDADLLRDPNTGALSGAARAATDEVQIVTARMQGNVVTGLEAAGQAFAIAGTYTWNQIQALTGMIAGTRVICSDIDYSEWIYDGADWLLAAPLRMSSGIPLIMPPSGTVAANGALTLDTALPATYPAAWMALPANAAFAGAAAGIYYVEMSSTTQGTIYSDTRTTSAPGTKPPATPAPIVAAGPGIFTPPINTDTTLCILRVRSGQLGKYGAIRNAFRTQYPNNANAKNLKVYFGSAGLGSQFSTHLGASVLGNSFFSVVSNAGRVDKQIGDINNSNGYAGSGSVRSIHGSVNTSAGVDLFYRLVANCANALDYIVVEQHITEMLR